MVSLPTQYPIFNLGPPNRPVPSQRYHSPSILRTHDIRIPRRHQSRRHHRRIICHKTSQESRPVCPLCFSCQPSHHISPILPWTNRCADKHPLRDRHLTRGGTFLTTINISANVASPSQLSVQCLILFLYPLATPHPHELGLPRRPRHLLCLDQPRSRSSSLLRGCRV